MIDPIFADLAAFLPPLIAEVRERQAALAGADPLPGDVPVERQAALSHRLAVAVGHDPDDFRIDSAPHPFSVPHSPGDVRFTTRYDEDNPPFSITATLHEAGHAMYEANLPRALRLPARRHGARHDRAREPVAVAGDGGRPQPRVPRLCWRR